MSLDVCLTFPVSDREKGSGIFIRVNGSTKEISREEWDKSFPGTEPVVFDDGDTDELFSGNITHNLGKMASESGLYKYLWRPDENNISNAGELIQPLRDGLDLLKSDPERFQKFNPPNGWGSYDGLVRFVSDYLQACEKYPFAIVRVWR